MVPLARIFRDYRTSGSLSELVSLWGFVGDATFLTKAGAVGTVFRVYLRDPECLDHTERRTVSERLEQCLRHLPESSRLYLYLLKRPAPPLRHPEHRDPFVNEALRRRAADLNARSNLLFEFDSYLVLLNERWGSAAQGLASATGPRALLRRLSTTRTQHLLDRQLAEAVQQLHQTASAVALHLADVFAPTQLQKAEAFQFFRRLLNYTPWKAAQGALKYDTHVDFLCR